MTSFWNNNGTKILGYLTTVLASVAGLISIGAFNGLLEENTVRWMAILITVLTGGTGLATAQRGHSNTAQVRVAEAFNNALNATPPKQGGFALPRFLVILAIAATVFLSGCAGNPTVAKELGYRIVTRQAIQRYIWEAGTDEKRAARADRIRIAATALRGLASGDAVTVGQLRAAAYAEIDRHNLIPPDRDLLRVVVDGVSESLLKDVGAGVLDPDRLVRVTEVLDWIIGAAYYQPSTSELPEPYADRMPVLLEV